MGKRGLVAGEFHHRARQGDRDPGLRVGDGGKTHRGQHVGIARQQLGALTGGEHAGFLVAAIGLPGCHRAPRAGAEIAVDQRIVEAFPFQGDLEILALVAVKRALGGERLLAGFFKHHRFGHRFRFGRGFGNRLCHRLRRGHDHRCGLDHGGLDHGGRHRRIGERIGADRPELLGVGGALGDVCVARDRALAAQLNQPLSGARLGVGAERDGIPTAGAESEAVHIRERPGIAARRVLGIAQRGVGFELHPVGLLRLGDPGGEKAKKNHDRRKSASHILWSPEAWSIGPRQ